MDDAFLITQEKELGVVIEKEKSGILLGKLIHRLAKAFELHGVLELTDEAAIQIICDRIKKLSKAKEAKTVFFAYDVEKGYTKNIIEKCCMTLSENGITVLSGNPAASLEAINALRGSNGTVVVLALTNKVSLSDSIKSNIAICEENEVPIIGNFIIHPQI